MYVYFYFVSFLKLCINRWDLAPFATPLISNTAKCIGVIQSKYSASTAKTIIIIIIT